MNSNNPEDTRLFQKRSSKEYDNKKRLDQCKSHKKRDHVKKNATEQLVKLVQPSSSYAEYSEPYTSEDIGRDFAKLVNVPLSEGGHFVFKSEKDWTVNISQYSDFFTLDLNTLSAAVSCVPFNKYVEIENKYFTPDQLTNINNTAEKGKKYYESILSSIKKPNQGNIKECPKISRKTTPDKDETNIVQSITELNLHEPILFNENEQDVVEDDLDFLLSLKEPIRCNTVTTTCLGSPSCTDIKIQPKNVPTKPVDLEKWLDSVLDD